MRFEKWQALGNDYLIFEEQRAVPAPGPALCATRISGPAADGVLVLTKPDEPGFVARLAIFNPDGSEAELSRQRRARGDPLPATQRLDGRRHVQHPDARR